MRPVEVTKHLFKPRKATCSPSPDWNGSGQESRWRTWIASLAWRSEFDAVSAILAV